MTDIFVYVALGIIIYGLKILEEEIEQLTEVVKSLKQHEPDTVYLEVENE